MHTRLKKRGNLDAKTQLLSLLFFVCILFLYIKYLMNFGKEKQLFINHCMFFFEEKRFMIINYLIFSQDDTTV